MPARPRNVLLRMLTPLVVLGTVLSLPSAAQASFPGKNGKIRLIVNDPVKAKRFPAILAEIRRLEEARRAVALYRSHPDFKAPGALGEAILRIVDKPLV